MSESRPLTGAGWSRPSTGARESRPTTGTRHYSQSLAQLHKFGAVYTEVEACMKIIKAFRIFLGAKRSKEEELKDQTVELQQEYEKMQITTIYHMVDTIDATVQDRPITVKCLYMTNPQAIEVCQESATRMPLVRKELGIKDPKMVIRLMPCHFGSLYSRTFPMFTDKKGGGRFPTKDVPEVDDGAQEKAEHQLILLAKEVLLPLAERTHSLVIGSESCALTAAFMRVSAPIQRQQGENCPFRLLIFAKAYFYQVCSEKPTEVAHHVRKGCKAWCRSTIDQNKMLEAKYGEDAAYWPREDLPIGQYSLVMFECVQDGKLAFEASNQFSNDFITSLSEELPVIALQTYGTNKMDTMPALAEHVMRGLPLMLLDSRERGESLPSDMSQVREELDKISERLHGRKWARCDQYFTSAMAFVKSCLEHFAEESRKETSAAQAGKAKDSTMWIWQAIENRLQESSTRAKTELEGTTQLDAKQQREDKTREKVIEATNILMEYVGGELEWESKALQDRCSAGIQKVKDAKDWKELKACFDSKETWCKIRSCCFHRFNEAREFQKANPTWFEVKTFDRDSQKGRIVFELNLDNVEEERFPEKKAALVKLLEDELEDSIKYDAKVKTKRSFAANQEMWLAVYNILGRENVHAGNIHDHKRISGKLFDLAQLDRLPQQNTLEALVLLRTAWSVVDVYNANAWWYKLYARLTHCFLLVIGVATVTFTVLCMRYAGAVTDTQQRRVLLGLALTGAFFTGFAAIVDPARKWIQLRNSAYAMEAEIWQFRARVGKYQGTSTSSSDHGRLQSERHAQDLLQEAILQIQGRVRLASGLKETSFFSLTMTADNLEPPLEEDDEADPLIGSMSSRLLQSVSSKCGSRSGSRLLSPVTMARRNELADRQKRQSGLKLRGAHFRHKQFKPLDSHMSAEKPRPLESDDSHHAPASPEDYIRWRMVPKINFYKGRIPKYAFLRRLFQGSLLISALTTSVLATLSMPSWTAIVAAVSSAVASGQEFLDVMKKLQRYSTIANSLANLLCWWQSLTEVEHADVKSFTFLVTQTESLLTSERDAWMGSAEIKTRLVTEDKNGKKAEEAKK